MAIILIVVIRIERQPLASIGLRRPSWTTLLWGLALTVAITFVLAPVITQLVDRADLPGYESGLQQLLGIPARYRIFLAVTAGVVEEALYRGYAVERLTSLTGSYWIGGSIPVIAFGLAHIPGWGLGPALVAFVPFPKPTIYDRRKSSAASLLNRFHQQLTAGKNAEIYEESSPELKQAISADEWIAKSEQLMKMSTPVNGVARAGNTKIISWNIKYKAFDGAYVTLQCKTQYAIGLFDETFVFVIRSGQAQLYSYGNHSFDILEEALKGGTVQIAEPSPSPNQSSASTQR
jgi:hypothetical protein